MCLGIEYVQLREIHEEGIAVSHGIRITTTTTTTTTSAALFSSAIIDLSKNDRDMEELANHVFRPSLRADLLWLTYFLSKSRSQSGTHLESGKLVSVSYVNLSTSRLLVFTTLLDNSLISGSGNPASRPYLAAERVHATLQ